MENKQKRCIILEAKERKRLSKRVRTEFFRLEPGGVWFTQIQGDRVSIIADKDNTGMIFVGKSK